MTTGKGENVREGGAGNSGSLSDEQMQGRRHRNTLRVRNALVPSLMAAGMSPRDVHLNPVVIGDYRDELLAEVAGGDPLEKMLIEQMAVAHHRALELHAQAAKSSDPAEVQIYNSAAARLTSEFRRCMDSIKQYRTPASGRSTTIIHRVEQANIANAGDQDIAYVDAGSEGGTRMNCREGKVESKEPLNDRFHDNSFNIEEPAARRSRQKEPAAAGAVD